MARPKKSNGTAVAATVEETPAQEFNEHRLSGEIPVRGVVDAVPVPKAEIVRMPRASESQIVRPVVTPEQAKSEWQNYIETCRAILEESDYSYYACAKKPDGYDQKPIVYRTRAGAEAQLELWKKQGCKELLVRETKKRSAWDKLARFYGIDTPIESAALCTTVEITQVGEFIIEKLAGDSFTILKYQDAATLTVKKANVLLRMVAPNGRVILGDGACSVNERKNGADSFTHPDHDIFATAYTRAFNRGVSRCIGTGEVSAEEFEAATPEEPKGATVASAPTANVPPKDSAKQNPGGVQEARTEPQPTAAPSAPAPAGSKTMEPDNNGVPRARIPTPEEIMASAKQKSFTVPSEETVPTPAQATQGLADSIPQRAEGTAHDAAAYQPLPESAKNSERITSINKFCFGDARTPDWLVWYLPFAVGEPSMLKGPYIIENATGIFQPKKCSEAINSLPDRKARFIFMENQLAEQGKDRFIAWGRAMVEAARARGAFGKK